MPFPPPPTDSLDWKNIGFQVRDVNGHIECRYTPQAGWSEPRFVRDPYLRLHGMTPGLNYGQQCYEGLKAFRLPPSSSSSDGGVEPIAVFRPEQNARRMQHSAATISIPPVPEALFVRSVRLAVGLNAAFVPPHASGAAMYVRPLLLASQAQLGLNPPCDEYLFAVYAMPTGVYHGVAPIDGLVLEDFDRAAPHGTGSAKVGGNYAPVLRWSDAAKADGFGITLHLDSKTRSVVDEFSTSGFIGLKKKTNSDSDSSYTLVVPDSSSVIKSVTSESACDLARSFGWTVERRPIRYEELASFDEVLAAGTAAALVPVKSVTMKSKGDRFAYAGDKDGVPGPAHQRLLKALQDVQRGVVKDTFGWLDIVPEPKDYEAESAIGQQQNGVDKTVNALP